MSTIADRVAAMVDANIAEHGFTVIATHDEKRQFSYTIGLSQRGWPELIIVGPGPRPAHGLIWEAVNHYTEQGDMPAIGDVPMLGRNTKGELVPVKIGAVGHWALDEYLCQLAPWTRRAGIDIVRAVQIIIPDREDRLPGAPDYDAAYMDPRQIPLNEARTWRIN